MSDDEALLTLWLSEADAFPRPWSPAWVEVDLRMLLARRAVRGTPVLGQRLLAERYGWPRCRVVALLSEPRWAGIDWEADRPTNRRRPQNGELSATTHTPVGRSGADEPQGAELLASNPTGAGRSIYYSSVESLSEEKNTLRLSHEPQNGELVAATHTPVGRTAARDPVRVAVREAALAVYAAWRAHHSHAPATPTDASLRMLTARVDGKSAVAVDDARHRAVLVVEWAHNAPDAAFFRGDNDRGVKYLGVETLFKPKGYETRVGNALAWAQRGKPREEASINPGATRELEAEAVRAWGYLDGLIRRSPTIPAKLPGEGSPQINSLRAAMKAVGVGRIRQSTSQDEGKLKAEFIAAYCAARKGGSS